MRACPVCGGKSREERLRGLLSCGSCGLVFRAVQYSGEPVYAPGLESEIYGSAKSGLFAAALDQLEDCLPERGRLLDVGCAGGGLLRAAAARGWIAEGVELSKVLAKTAAALGFKVYTEPAERAGLEPGSYDAAVVFEVFCLMRSPLEAATALFWALKPGGMIYIREFNSAFHLPLLRLQQAGFFDFLAVKPAVEHNFNFSAHSISELLRAAGFRNIQVRNSVPTSGDPYRSGGRLGGFSTGLLKFLYYTLAQALWFLSLGRVYAGSSLIVTARK